MNLRDTVLIMFFVIGHVLTICGGIIAGRTFAIRNRLADTHYANLIALMQLKIRCVQDTFSEETVILTVNKNQEERLGIAMIICTCGNLSVIMQIKSDTCLFQRLGCQSGIVLFKRNRLVHIQIRAASKECRVQCREVIYIGK